MKLVKITITDTLTEILNSMSNTYATMLLSLDGIQEDLLVENYVDFLSLSQDHTKISYAHVPKDGSDILSSKRYSCKPGAFLQKLFKQLDMRQVEIFSNQFKSWTSIKDFEFSVVEGDEIVTWYHENKYNNQVPKGDRSSLHASCMKYGKCSKYLKVYADNSDKVKMLILTKNGYLVGRALLWYISDDTKVMDRIYTYDDDKLPSMFMNWADNNGFIYKFFQRWNNNIWFGSKGEKIYKEISFKLELEIGNYLPYFDTFKFYNYKTKVISNVPSDVRNQIILISPEGGYNSDGSYLKQDYFNKEFYYRNDLWHFSYIKDKDIWAHRGGDNVVYSSVNDLYILLEDAYKHNTLGWIFREKNLNKSSVIDAIDSHEEKMRRKSDREEKGKTARIVADQSSGRSQNESLDMMRRYAQQQHALQQQRYGANYATFTHESIFQPFSAPETPEMDTTPETF
jgi:hypothetical protein